MKFAVNQLNLDNFPSSSIKTLLLIFALSICSSNSHLVKWAKQGLSLTSSAALKPLHSVVPVISGESLHVRSGSSESDRSLTNKSDYDAMCLISRKAELREPPILFFFSGSTTADGTFDCTEQTSLSQIKLVPNKFTCYEDEGDGDQSTSSTDSDEELERQRNEIKTELIDSGLYDGKLSTYVLVHGFMANWNSDPWMCKLKDLILNKSEANVFILDWSGGSKPMLPGDYGQAVANTRYVGALLASFINQLIELSGEASADNFHLIGHSLGAHISGFAGYSLQDEQLAQGKSVDKLGSIVAFDPAGPCFGSALSQDATASSVGFTGFGSRRRLSASSARLVKALHTDTTLFGLNENCAHYDIYVNGGSQQPGCSLFDVGFSIATCAHSFSHDLIDSLSLLASPVVEGLTNLAGLKENEKHQTASSKSTTKECCSMAHRCDSYKAYKAGECGLCPRDDDGQCVQIGLDLAHGPSSKKRTVKRSRRNLDSLSESDISELVSEGQHFIQTGQQYPRCLYQYQVIISQKIPQSRNEKSGLFPGEKLYLELPLTKGDQKKKVRRLIEVSHEVSSEQLPADEFYTQFQKRSSLNGKLRYLTALLSFDSSEKVTTNEGNCSRGGWKSDTNHWTLCQPLPVLEGAKLHSGSQAELNATQWIALNYMSGYRVSDRVSNSLLLLPKKVTGESSAGQTNSDFSEPSSIGNLVTGIANSVLQVIDCLMDEPECSTIGYQLNHSLELRTIRQTDESLLKHSSS